MGEVVNVLVAVAVIVFIVKWATSGKSEGQSGQSPSSVLGFRPKEVTTEMLETVHNMFPDIPSDNIRYDLLRTGSVERTSNTILEKGYLLAPPPAYYTLYPRALDPEPRPNAHPQSASAAGSSQLKPKSTESLITRYHLQDRVAVSTGALPSTPEEAGGRAVWEDTAEKREQSLRERKAKMILAARERLLAQEREKAQKTP